MHPTIDISTPSSIRFLTSVVHHLKILTVLMLVFFQAWLAGVPAVRESLTPISRVSDALWLAHKDRLLKIDLSEGSLLLAVPTVNDLRTLAVDNRRGLVWAYGKKQLFAFAFDGELLLNIPVSVADTTGPKQDDKRHLDLEVNSNSGTVWLGLSRSLCQFDAAGELLNVLPLPEKVEALALDPVTDLLWVATRRMLLSYEESGGPVQVLELRETTKIEDLTIDTASGDLWVLEKNRLSRVQANGTRLFASEIKKLSRLATDHQGGIWLARNKELLRVDPSGVILFEVRPLGKKLELLASDPLDGSVWVGSRRQLAQVTLDGEVLRRLQSVGQEKLHLRDLALYVDVIAPEIAFLTPRKGDLLRDNTPLIELSLRDTGAGVDLASLDLQVGDRKLQTSCSLEGTRASCIPAVPLPDGLLQLSASLKDFNGNLSEPALVSVTLDTIPPRLNFTAPFEGDTIKTATPVVEIMFHDTGSGVDPQTLQIQANGRELAANCTFDIGRASCAPETRLVEGPNTLTATIKDQAGNLSGMARVSFTVLTTGAPDLSPIGDQAVAVGSRLRINLTAVDPEMDPLTFSASPVPLPDNASLNAQTGVFTFTPVLGQAGVLALTFIVSDGVLADAETITLTVNGPPAGGVTELTGRILDTNDFVLGTETPVVGATVSLLNTGVSTLSDINGAFTLTSAPPGSQILDIETSTANLAPEGSTYAGFREKIELIANVSNVVDRPFFLPRIDPGGLATVDPNLTTIVNNPTLGTTMSIPPNTAQNPDGTNFTGEISISEVPEGLAPASLPEGLEPGLLLTIQPVGVTFATPIPLTTPNIDNMPPGSELDLLSLDPETGLFKVVGTGRVSADGSVIETLSGGIVSATWHCFCPPDGDSNTDVKEKESTVQDPTKSCQVQKFSSSATLRSGCLGVDFFLPSYRSFGVSRSPRFVYQSLRAHPQPVIPFNATISLRAAVPPQISYQLSVAGIAQGTETFVDSSGLNENLDETLRVNASFDGSGFETGLYPYTVRLRSNYLASRVATILDDEILVINEQSSPLGAGWGIEGVAKLHFINANSVLLVSGQGGAILFSGGPTAFTSPAGDFSTLANNLDGTFTRTLKDGTRIHFDSQGLQRSVVDRNGNTTSFAYDGQGQLTSITDPAGLTTTLVYTGGHLSSLTDPAARTTTFDHDAEGNLIKVTFPDSSFRSFGYDSRHLMTSETDERNFTAQREYDSLGRLVQATLADGSIRSTTNSQTVGSVDLSTGVGTPANPAPVVRPADAVNSFTDANGNRQTIETDRFGAATRITDALGRTTLIERSSGNNGTLISGATFDQGQVGQAFSLEGPADQVLIDNSANLQLQDFTLTAWIRLSTLSLPAGGAGIFACGQNGYGFFVAGPSTGSGPGGLSPIQDRELLLSKIGSNAVSSQGVAIPDTNWHHVAVTKNGGTVVFYLDGVGFPVPISYDPDFSFNSDIAIGNRPDGFPNDFPGLIDEVQIFERELSAEEIESIFAIGSSGNRTTPLPGLLSSWQAEGDAIDIAGNHGLPTRITRANGAVTTMTYDALGNLLTSTEEAINTTTTFSYEPVFNRITSITDPESNSTTINYDGNGKPIEIIDAKGTHTLMAYADPNCPGQVTSVTAASGLSEENTTIFQYDPVTCNLTQTIDPLLNTTTLVYDSSGNVVQSTDGEGRITRFQYDGLNRLTKVIDATILPPTDPACGTAGVTCYQSDGNGNLTQVTDAQGSTTLFEYDTEDRLIKTTDPLGNFETVTYDDNGNLLSTTDRNGQTIDFQYDVVNQLVQKTLLPGTPEEAVTTFAYDSAGNLTAVTDPDSALTLTYDPLNRLASVSTAGSSNQPEVLIDYVYDKNGNRLTLTDPTGQTQYVYDELNRPTDLTNPSLQTVTFDYDALSRRSQLSLPNGVVTSYNYDDSSQLLSLVHQLGAGTVSDFSYTYDKMGNRTSLSQQRSAVIVNPVLDYTYDELNRLVDATHPLPSNPLETFDYDAVGNRLLRNGHAFSAILDAANRLLEDEEFCYTYDLNGNLRSKEAKVTGICSGAGQWTEYDYDPENQLIEVRVNGTLVGNYRYDGLGRRIEKDASGVITQYVYDNEDILLEFDGNAVPGPVDVVYDLTADWSDTINPNNPWSYNSAPDTPILNHFDDWDTLNLDFTSDQPAWSAVQSPTVGQVPVWFKTISPTISTDLPTGTVGVHGSDPVSALAFTDAGVGWTSPADGDVAILGGLWLARKTLGRSMDWRLKINGTLISDGSLTFTDSFTSANPFDLVDSSGGAGALNFAVVAGDVVDLELVKAPASPFSEFVGLNLTIIQTVSTVPPMARYTHGPGIDEPLIMERDLDSNGTLEDSERFYYQANGLGSVTELTDSEGVVAQVYTYDSFGQIVQQLGTLPNPYTYTGREFDEETGLYHYRARYYHPDSGRFTTEDPIAFLGGINFYVMTQNSPTNWGDPWGLWRTAGHRTLTTAAMKRAGFSTLDIDIANKANRSVDNVTNWFNDPEHYMPGTGSLAEMFIEKKLNEAVEKALAGNRQGALEALGKGLHPVQDKWSHQMQSAGWMAHNPFGQNADSVKDHIAEYASALKGTQDYVKRFLQGVGGICAFNAKAE